MTRQDAMAVKHSAADVAQPPFSWQAALTRNLTVHQI